MHYQRRIPVPEDSLTLLTKAVPLLEVLSAYRAEPHRSLGQEVFEDLFLEPGIGLSYLGDRPIDAAGTDRLQRRRVFTRHVWVTVTVPGID